MFKSTKLIQIIRQHYMETPLTDKLNRAIPYILATCVGSCLTGLGLAAMQQHQNKLEADFCSVTQTARLLITSKSSVGTVKTCIPTLAY